MLRLLLLPLLVACGSDIKIGAVSVDADSDGYDQTVDCDDGRQDVNPTAPELCDGRDNDCDGVSDEDPVDGATWYADVDADGYGDPSAETTACDAPEGWTADATDCDDADADIHPDAEEGDCADPIDYNCDGSVAYVDADGDGWVACEECDDSAAARNPGNLEVCDGSVDEDCDSLVDDDDPSVTDPGVWYGDGDGDGWGDADRTIEACEAPSGYVADPSDCDDSAAAVSPDGAETCDEADQDEDCDGVADDDDPSATGQTSWTIDGDGDGYGGDTTLACDSPVSAVTLDGDCDDGDATISPEGDDLCEDGVDQDCDGLDARCPLGGAYGETDALARILGPSADARFPSHTLGMGDVDGDGADDVMVVWSYAAVTTTYQGAGYLFRGPLAGDYTTSDADATVYGESRGYRIDVGARVGDVDGDGVDDVLLASSAASPYGTSSEGMAWVVQGPLSGTSSSSAADTEIAGGIEHRQIGEHIDGLGDLDGDGLDDFGVGGGGSSSEDDGLGIFYGPADGSYELDDGDVMLYGELDTDGICTVAGRTDLDGDGVGDLLVGAMFNDVGGLDAGATYLLTGPVSSGDLGSLYTRRWVGDASSDWLGSEVGAPGDLDGDGHEDLVVIGYTYGVVFVIYGDTSAPASGAVSGAASAQITPSHAWSMYLGEAPAGDVDLDGDTELYVNDWVDSTSASSAGMVGLFDAPMGALTAADAEVTFAGASAGDQLGMGANAFDMNGDGYLDAVMSAYGHDAAAEDAGAVLLFAF